MPKTLAEQIAGRCIHYNGAGNGPTCDAGIRYDDVRDDTVTKGWRLPCLRESVAKPCPKCEFPTPEAQAKVADFAGLKRVQYLNTQGQIETRLGMNLLDLAQRMERAAARRAAR